jgi:leucyl aminopeptidase
MGGALARLAGGEEYKPKARAVQTFNYPAGLTAERVVLASLGDEPGRDAARRAGGAIAAALAQGPVTLCAAGLGDNALVAEMIWAMVVRLYEFRDYKKDTAETKKPREIAVMADGPEALAAASAPFAALAEGIFFTRDLVNEPANTLTTDEFAARLGAMGEMGLEVEILGEPELAELGCKALLAVGQGSESESKLVVMKWMGGGDERPLALVGKGVVFDTGGISLKPAAA